MRRDCVVDYADLEILIDNWLAIGDEVTPVAVSSSDPALLLHYTFDGHVNDDSGHGNHGIPKGGATYVAGVHDQAISLDGIDDYVAVQNLQYISPGQAQVTVCAWIRTDSSIANQAIVSFDRNEYWRLEIGGEGGGSPGKVGWSVMTSTEQLDSGGGTRVDDGQWHHVAGVFEDGALLVYVDGNRKVLAWGGTTFGTGTVRYGFVGSRSEADAFDGGSGVAWRFHGELDDVRLYDRALSQAEVAHLAGKVETFTQPLHLLLSPGPAVNMYEDHTIDFMDYALLLDNWLDETLWP
jgi:hypothetical protein